MNKGSMYRSMVRQQSIPHTVYKPTVDETSYDDTETLVEAFTEEIFVFHPSERPIETPSGTMQQGGMSGFALPSTQLREGHRIQHGSSDGSPTYYEVDEMNGMPNDEDVEIYELTLERDTTTDVA